MNKKGFTLVEILAVILILGILVTVAMTAVVPRINQAKKEAFIIDAKNILKAAEGLYGEKQALNELPNVYNKNIEGIYKKYFYNVDRQDSYTAYAIDIEDLKSTIDIKDDYKGAVFFADYGDYVKSYINLTNDDFSFVNKNKCTKNNINMCFYSIDNLNADLLINKEETNVKQIEFDDINTNNSTSICLYC